MDSMRYVAHDKHSLQRTWLADQLLHLFWCQVAHTHKPFVNQAQSLPVCVWVLVCDRGGRFKNIIKILAKRQEWHYSQEEEEQSTQHKKKKKCCSTRRFSSPFRMDFHEKSLSRHSSFSIQIIDRGKKRLDKRKKTCVEMSLEGGGWGVDMCISVHLTKHVCNHRKTKKKNG